MDGMAGESVTTCVLLLLEVFLCIKVLLKK